MQLSEAAPLVGARTQRDATFTSLGFASHDAPRMLVFLESEAHLDGVLANPAIAGVLASEALAAAVPERLGLAVAANPRLAFYTLHNHLVERTDFYGARRATQVAASARVDASAHVAEHDVRIGERVVVEPRAVIMPRVVLEDDVIVRAGTVVGSQGLQASVVDGRMLKVAHGGGVIMRRFPNGSQIISMPDGTRVFVSPEGTRTVVPPPPNRANRQNRRPPPSPSP